jgi:hypothetical protein
MAETIYQPGDVVRLRAYKGEILIRRVWQDVGRGVAICSEGAYQRALQTGEEPNCVGWPREDVLEIVTPAARTASGQGEEQASAEGVQDG